MSSLSTENRQGAHTLPARNPRRRTRQEIDGSASLRQTRRKRSKLDDGSAALVEPNGHIDPRPEEPLTNGHDPHDTPPVALAELTLRDTDRPRANSLRRPGLAEEALTTLTKSEVYQAGRLPTVPDELRGSNEAYFGSVFASAHLALAVTRSRAFIWDYSTPHSSSTARIFSLPYPSKEPEPLPVAAIVKNGNSSDTGLVVVAAQSGKVTFWENIENAAALSLFEQKRNGTEGSLGSMLSGEMVTDIEYADPAGFVLTFSTGRVAQLFLWDSQSRPTISVRYLKSPKATTGYLGGLWSALGIGGFLKDVVAVRSHPSKSRGLADVLVASDQAVFQQWQLSWTNPPVLRTEINAKHDLDAAIRRNLQQSLPSEIQKVSLLDFVIASTLVSASSATFHLLTLVAVRGADFQTHALMELSLMESGSINCGRICSLTSYAAPLLTDVRWAPRICFPSHASTVFVIFEKAVTILSWTEGKEQPLQDTIYLKDDNDVYVTGAKAEIYDKKRLEASAILHIRSHGPVRLTAFEHAFHSSGGKFMSARTKIEQAVFYGTKESNPFNLAKRPEFSHSRAEVAKAALDVSKAILTSQYPNLFQLTASMSKDLYHRAKALEDLGRHIKYAYPGLDASTRWRLLWDAEKLAAARKIWADYEASNNEAAHKEALFIEAMEANQASLDEQQSLRQRKKPVSFRLLPNVIEQLHPDYKNLIDNPGPTFEELIEAEGSIPDRNDDLREFFRHDLNRFENVLPWTYQAIYRLAKRFHLQDSDALLSLVGDGCDLISGGLEACFKFREQNVWLYGLDQEKLSDGLLVSQSSYADLPVFWTSTAATVTKIKEFITNAEEAALSPPTRSPGEGQEAAAIIAKIAGDIPGLISAWSRTFEERYRWSQAQSDDKTNHEGREQYQESVEARTEMLAKLASLEQGAAGMELAEKYDDMKALTILLSNDARKVALQQALVEEEGGGGSEPLAQRQDNRAGVLAAGLADLTRRTRLYCDKYGYKFTNPYYSAMVKNGDYKMLLAQSDSYGKEVTEYLRAEPGRRKLAWINDILVERDYAAAGKTLTAVSIEESAARTKKIALSMSKLALLAASEGQPAAAAAGMAAQRLASDHAEILETQQSLDEHVREEAYGAMDAAAEVQLLMEAYAPKDGKLADKSRLALRQLLEMGFEALAFGQSMSAEQLADVLTLMEIITHEDPAGFDNGSEYAWALKALRAASGAKEVEESRLELARLVTWRRAYLEDDWPRLNETGRKSDEQVELKLQGTVLFKTFADCLKFGILSPTSSPPSPQDVLSVGTTTEEQLPRFRAVDVAERIALAVAAEESELGSLMKTANLERWVGSTWELAVRQKDDMHEYEKAEKESLLGYALDELAKERARGPGADGVNGVNGH